MGDTTVPTNATSDAPRRVDKYEILANIGDGGMASVYRARLQAPGGASKQVALKLIHPHLSHEPDFIRMFLDEMRVAMVLSHRNIVQTFDAGKFEDRYYLVMELMESGSLSGLLRRLTKGQHLPLELSLFVALEICSALDYAHNFKPERRGVVHRDVSPGNILLSAQGDVKLADFGVAKAAGRITSSVVGMVKGKLSYMAPEQARGQVEPRSDLFALGAVLYLMLVGVPLRHKPSLEQVRLGTEEVLLPRGDVSPQLRRLVASCLHRDLAGRPASAAELRQQLAGELERVQRKRTGPTRDPHSLLRDFLAPLAEPTAPEAPPAQAQRLADAMMEMALAVPTEHGAAGAARAQTAEATLTIQTDQLIPSGPPPLPDHSITIEPATAVDLSASREAGSPSRARETTAALDAGTRTERVRRTAGDLRPRRLRALVVVLLVGGLLLLLALGVVWLLRPWTEPPPRVVSTSDLAAPALDGGALDPPHPSDGALPDRPRPTDGETPDQRRPAWVRGDRGPPRAPRFGRLDLNASPWARVYLGARLLGETPLQGVRLPMGRHRLRLVNPARGLSAQVVVRIRAGRTTRTSVRLGR